MELFFASPENISDHHTVLDDFEARHILKTLRRKTGDTIEFTDGAGGHFRGRISRERPVLELESQLVERYPRPRIRVIAGVGFIKQARLDYLIEKGTELGIDTFMFFNSRFANYFTDNTDRWKKIGRQAMKQSLRYYLPEFRVFRSFEGFLDHTRQIPVRILADQSADLSWQQAIGEGRFSGDEIVFAIGPEGGLDQNEIKTALAAGFTGISFGDYRLRTETAVLGTAAVLNTLRE